MHLTSPEQNVSGVIFAGIPGIILGHNDEIAWGVTNVGPDVQDLYIEIPNPDDPTQFRYDGKWEQAEIVRLKCYDELTFKQIAELLSIPEPTAKSRYRYAIMHIQQMIKKKGYER